MDLADKTTQGECRGTASAKGKDERQRQRKTTASNARNVGPTIWLGQRTPTPHEKTVAEVRKKTAEANRAAARTTMSRKDADESRGSTIQPEVTETFHLPARCRLGLSATLGALQRRHSVVIKVPEGNRPDADGYITGSAARVSLALRDIHKSLDRISRQQQWVPPHGPF